MDKRDICHIPVAMRRRNDTDKCSRTPHWKIHERHSFQNTRSFHTNECSKILNLILIYDFVIIYKILGGKLIKICKCKKYKMLLWPKTLTERGVVLAHDARSL